jgi:hypothetical protein
VVSSAKYEGDPSGSDRHFVVLPGTAEDISGLLTTAEADRKRLAESALLVTSSKDRRIQSAHWLSKPARTWLAGVICGGG